MTLFADTSAFVPLLVHTDVQHEAVRDAFRRAIESGRRVVTTNYVLVETVAVLQNRIGLLPVRDFDTKILPLVDVVFVDAATHMRAVDRLLKVDRRRVSLVDVTSFEVMDANGIADVLGLDADFEGQGFRLVPKAPLLR
ncbi:MAG: type II toxin-antitoxin system VapC family toxin [Gemmatimonadales bacterium]